MKIHSGWSGKSQRAERQLRWGEPRETKKQRCEGTGMYFFSAISRKTWNSILFFYVYPLMFYVYFSILWHWLKLFKWDSWMFNTQTVLWVGVYGAFKSCRASARLEKTIPHRIASNLAMKQLYKLWKHNLNICSHVHFTGSITCLSKNNDCMVLVVKYLL